MAGIGIAALATTLAGGLAHDHPAACPRCSMHLVRIQAPAPSRGRAELERAARDGNAAAMIEVAEALLDGRWGRSDPAQAVRLLKVAAARNDPRASRLLAELHDRGRHAERDPDEAARLLLASFAGENSEAAIVAFESEAAVGNVWAPATLRALQRRLRDAGRYEGPIDGIIGTRSLLAVREHVDGKR